MTVVEKPAGMLGAREWAKSSGSCTWGCPYGCKYCYAAFNAVKRHLCPKDDLCEDYEAFRSTWIKPRKGALTKTIKLQPEGTHFFPLSHDIWPGNLADCKTYILRWVRRGNHILIVTKPNMQCITELCRVLKPFDDLVVFRFTIGANNSQLLKYWEPFAPSYEERRRCLMHAYASGFQTSVCCEPILDISRAPQLYHELVPYISESFWFGPMRQPQRFQPDILELRKNSIISKKNSGAMQQLYQRLKSEPYVCWKDAFRAAVPEAKNSVTTVLP